MGELGRFRTYWRDASPGRGNLADRSPESVASVLRNARLIQGYDLAEIARSLNIREGHLEALEEGRFRDLPPLVYAKGFVRAYADFLQLDCSEMVTRFQSEATNDNSRLTIMPQAPQFQPGFKPEVDAETRRRPGLVAIIAGLLLAAFAYGFWHTAAQDDREAVLAVPPLPVRLSEPAVHADLTMASAPADIEPVAIPVDPQLVTTASPRIELRATGDGWVQLRNSRGERVASLMLKPGQSYTVPAGPGLRLTTGNLSHLSILVGGQPATLTAPLGRARVEVLLDPALLLDGTAVLN